ncbi:MAG: XRE family transcriptional regulator [Allosphingosinicella sp.]
MMITNEKQLRSTRTLIDGLRESRNALATSTDVHPMFVDAQRAALDSQMEELEEDVALYEALRSGLITTFEADGLHDLPDILIRARIARAMSQRDLADFLGMKEQQVQRYEAERYRSASLERLVEIADALNVKITERGELVGNGAFEDLDLGAASAFPIAEMFKRGWFEDFEGSLSAARKEASSLVQAFLKNACASWTPTALHRKSMRANGQVHEPAIAAWEARVLTLADRHRPAEQFVPAKATESWVEQLVYLSAEPDGPKRVGGHLRKVGIVLVIEPHLPGTLLDGAALRSAFGTAIIGMTLRHDRLDNFWFTLLHEVAHLKLHIDVDHYSAIFDDTESPAGSKTENEADQFAQEALLPSSRWHACVSRFTRTEKAVLADAKRFGISPSIIAGRIRREANDYTLLRALVGAGEPRRQLSD